MKQSICALGISLRQVYAHVNAEPIGIAFVVDSEDRLDGVVTDGDLRRMVLSGRQLDDELVADDLGECVRAKVGEDVPELLAKINRRIRFIPIVDDDGVLRDFFRFEHKTHFTPVARPDLDGNELNYVTDAILSTWISSRGKYINKFEEEFAGFCEAKHGVAVANGTVALQLAIRALGIGPGDEVILPDLTFAATANAVLNEGATPVIVDVDETSYTIDPEAIRAAVTERSKAIIVVHLYGQPCDMAAIKAVADAHDLRIIEDAAEAHGARFEGQRVGGIGDIGCFSFFANKIITTGEGGMCTTQSDELMQRMRILRDHGMNPKKRYWHDFVGYNFRMTNIQAAIGCAQLERIDDILARHREIEDAYRAVLSDIPGVTFQHNFPDRDRVTWLVSLLCQDRGQVAHRLKEANIETRPFFYPMSDMPVYQPYCAKTTVAKRLSELGLNLPTVGDVSYQHVQEAFLHVLGA